MSNQVLICSKCEWKVDDGLSNLFKLDAWLPPCSVCNGIMEGYRIIEKGLN